ncbi:MAG: antitoxin YefM [Candidatus Omnitrophota bacterium]
MSEGDIMKNINVVPVTEFRIHALEAVRRVNRLGDEIVITANGRPAAVLISFDEWESIVETVAIKRDPKIMSQIKASTAYLSKGGKGIPADSIDWGNA